VSEETGAVQRIDAGAPVAEELPSLADFYEEPSGGISLGWHGARIIAGYPTQKGTQFQTSDNESANGRRALRYCLSVNDGGTEKTTQQTYFYDPQMFTNEGIARVKELRAQFKGVKSWPGHGPEQNLSITLGALSQLEKAVGFQLKRHPAGGFITAPYIGQQVDVRIGRDKDDYTRVTAFAKFGEKSRSRS
jgi:hypothetical protein